MRRPPPAPPLEFLDATHVRAGRRTLLYCAGCNYLGLSFDARLRRSMSRAALAGSLQPGASRGTTGEQAAYRRLERRLARFFRAESALFTAVGYLAPLAVGQGLRELFTHVLLDQRAHASVADGVQLGGRPVRRFAASDPGALARALRALPREARPLVATDGTWGTRGGFNPVDAYLDLLPDRGWLLVDDAHGAGTVGPGGRGWCAALGLQDPRLVQTVSLAKAFGVQGGAVLGGRAAVNQIRHHAASVMGTTSPLLPTVAGVEAALRIVAGRRSPVGRLQANLRLFQDLLPDHPRLLRDARSPILAIEPSDAREGARLYQALLSAGVHPPRIRYLDGPASGFFRFAISARHTSGDLRRLADAVGQALAR
ncbi:MAG: aminotransferase class I/II-fold pyridoxal phosphate-dependent enzyme [Verrucomicrobiota bacterium]